MVQDKKYTNRQDNPHAKAFIDVIKSAYERGTTDSSITTQEFVEEIRIKLMSIYA